MTRYLEIIFRSRLRLLVLVVLLPIALSGLDFYLVRSYAATEVVNIDDPGIFGQGIGNALGFNPYETVAQNYARIFSNLIGTQSFNEALGNALTAQGFIQTDRERAVLLASLNQLTITPGGASSAGASGSSGASSSGAPAGGDHTVIVSYACTKEAICLNVLGAVLDVFRTQYGELKARASATARAIYVDDLKAAQASLAAAIAAEQQYLARQPKSNGRSPQTDPALTALSDNVQNAQKDVSAAQADIQRVDTLTQVANGIASDLKVIDGPRTLKGLYGIRGLSSTNVKTDAIAWASCLLAAAMYVLLVAFLDRTVRDPDLIKRRLAKTVITIPAYQTQRSSRGKARGRWWPPSWRRRAQAPA